MLRITLLAMVLGLASPLVAGSQSAERLPIGRTGGPQGGTLQSEQVQPDGSRVLHGLQVVYGPQLQIKEYSVYNQGRCEQLVQFFPRGNVFREQSREHNGDGSEAIYASAANEVVAEKVIVDGGQNIGPIKTQERVCFGRVRAGRCFEGTFLVRELQAFQFVLRLQEYKEGRLVASKPFPLEKLGLTAEEADVKKWRWSFPDWPRAGKE